MADILSLSHAVYVTSANVNDRVDALEMMEWNFFNLTKVKKFLFDGGYEGADFTREIQEIMVLMSRWSNAVTYPVFVSFPNAGLSNAVLHGFDKYRRMWRNCERKLDTSFQLILAAFIAVLIKRF
jgi:hypothetical protein